LDPAHTQEEEDYKRIFCGVPDLRLRKRQVKDVLKARSEYHLFTSRDPTFGEFVPRLGISATFGEKFGKLRYLGMF